MSAAIQNQKTACIILSGGLSSRMNKHKALLRFSDQQNFLQHIIGEYQNAGITNIIVVKNSEISTEDLEIASSCVSIIDNPFPERGRLYSIQLALRNTQQADHYFIQNIDNPFVTSDLINDLYILRSRAEYIAPQYRYMGGHPVLISAPIANEISRLKEYKKTLRDVLEGYTSYKLITNDENCILNINLPSDYDKLFLSSNKLQTLV